MKKFTLLLVLTIFSLSSCKKEKETIGIVTVTDFASNPKAGVYVRVYCPNSTCNNIGSTISDNTNRTGITDSDGKVSFNYTDDFKTGQAGFAVLDIVVYRTEADMIAYTNEITTGIIKIEEEQTNEQPVTCK